MFNLSQIQALSELLPGQSTESGTALQAVLGVGFAAAAAPLVAPTAIKTPADAFPWASY